jgi:SAM-dependent methyltransferase
MIVLSCNICRAEGENLAIEEAQIRSNVRAFAEERFRVWRCRACGSIHARDEVDLARYYARYPFHDLPIDWRLRLMYENQLLRLKRAGLRREHTILDYGCGGGYFVSFLQARGYRHVAGFDEYSEKFRDRRILERRYDCLIAQDLIEHVASPHAMLDEFDGLLGPGGILAIGTPNASAIDLLEPERTIHALHLPYHRHIFSKQALINAGSEHGLELYRYYPTQYANTLFPFLNSAFYLYYTRLIDNSLDALMDPPKVWPLLARFPLTLFWGFFGYLLSPETDVMAVFRRPVAAPVRERERPQPRARSQPAQLTERP